MEIDVRHVAKLAKLKIPEDKLESFSAEMAARVKEVEKLPEITDATALLDPQDMMCLREDVVLPSMPREDILQNAPQAAAGCFLVPKTVD